MAHLFHFSFSIKLFSFYICGFLYMLLYNVYIQYYVFYDKQLLMIIVSGHLHVL